MKNIARALVGWFLLGLVAVPALAGQSALSSDRTVKIGILTTHAGMMGEGNGGDALLAAQMAVEDFGGTVLDKPIEIVVADHQNRPTLGSSIARRWLEHGGADVILDVPNPAVARAVRQTVREHHGLMIQSQSGMLFQPECQSNVIVWSFDGALMTRSALAALKERGHTEWALLSPETRHSAETASEVREAMLALGIKLLAEHGFALPMPHGKVDSGLAARLVARPELTLFLNAGPLAAKTLATHLHKELDGKRLPPLFSQSYLAMRDPGKLAALTDTVYYALPYHPDGAAVKELSARFARRDDGRMPSPIQIGIYAAVLDYLRAVRALGADRPGELVGAKMQELPINDPVFGRGAILPDGRRAGDVYVMAHRQGSMQDTVVAQRPFTAVVADAAGLSCHSPVPATGGGAD